MPQFNWPVFGPLVGILTVLFVVSFVIGSRVLARPESSSVPSVATGSNPERDAPLPASPGRGGPTLVPPAAAELRLFSLPARVLGAPTVRKGPGTQYGGLHSLQNGEEVHLIACSPGCEWYRILSLSDPGVQFWAPAAFLSVSGKPETLPVLKPE